jgi:dihydrofolate reductase
VFICGGDELYRQALPLADRIFLTIVHHPCNGDAYFPPLPGDFAETGRTECEEGAPCTFIVYGRIIAFPGTALPSE